MDFDNKATYLDNFRVLVSVIAGVTKFEVKSSVTDISGEDTDKYAFRDCKGTITDVTFQSNSQLRTIHNCAFYGCNLITSMDLSGCNCLEEIQLYSFEFCGIQSIKFPSCLSIIRRGAFWYSGLRSVEFPANLSILGEVSFGSCLHLNKVTFAPNIKLKKLEQWTFEYDNLTTFKVPAATTEITGLVLRPQINLKTIEVESEEHFRVIEGMLCTANGEDLVICPPSYSKEKVTVPSCVKRINKYSFHSCQAKEVVLNDNIILVDDRSFKKSLITKIKIPPKVTNVGEEAFSLCHNLKTVELSEGIKSFDYNAFSQSGIESIVLPNSIVELKTGCFDGCTNLTSIVLPANLTKLEGGVFTRCSPDLNVSFAPGSKYFIDKQLLISTIDKKVVTQYIGATPKSTVIISNLVERIAEGAFSSNTCVSEVVFEDKPNITKIGKSAFDYCTSLCKITFPPSLTYIYDYAFRQTNLTVVKFTNPNMVLGSNTFERCYQLLSVEVPEESAIWFGGSSFSTCPKLWNITLKEGMTNITDSLFYGCKMLKELHIPSTITCIGKQAFIYSGIETITFNTETSQLTTINSYAFAYCSELTVFPVIEGVTSIGRYAFMNDVFETVVLPKSLTKIEIGCFKDCHNLVKVSTAGAPDSKSKTDIAVEAPLLTELVTIEERVFEGCDKFETVSIYSKGYTTYNNILLTSNLSNIVLYPVASPSQFIYIPGEVINIMPYAFEKCKNILCIAFPDDSSLSDIGPFSFSECKNLKYINIPTKTQFVGINAFSGCFSLSCNLIILNETKEFREGLVRNGKMPRRCIEPCALKHTFGRCDQIKSTYLIEGLFILINGKV